MQRARAVLRFICGLSVSIIFSTLPHKRQDFRNKKSYENINAYFDFAYNFFLAYVCLREEFSEIFSEMYTSVKKKKISVILV